MAILSEQRTDFAGDFLGFTFNDYHSSVFGITRVSSSNRYDNNLLPTIQDKTIQTPGGDGTYYFGSYYTQKQFTLQIAFDSISEKQLRRLSEVFGDKGIHDLIFDESPYKIYSVKCTGQPQLKYICFDQYFEEDQDGTIINKVHRVYKGEGTLQFTAYYPFARSRFIHLNQNFTINFKDIDGNITKYNNTAKGFQNVNNTVIKTIFSNLDEWNQSGMIPTGGDNYREYHKNNVSHPFTETERITDNFYYLHAPTYTYGVNIRNFYPNTNSCSTGPVQILEQDKLIISQTYYEKKYESTPREITKTLILPFKINNTTTHALDNIFKFETKQFDSTEIHSLYIDTLYFGTRLILSDETLNSRNDQPVFAKILSQVYKYFYDYCLYNNKDYYENLIKSIRVNYDSFGKSIPIYLSYLFRIDDIELNETIRLLESVNTFAILQNTILKQNGIDYQIAMGGNTLYDINIYGYINYSNTWYYDDEKEIYMYNIDNIGSLPLKYKIYFPSLEYDYKVNIYTDVNNDYINFYIPSNTTLQFDNSTGLLTDIFNDHKVKVYNNYIESGNTITLPQGAYVLYFKFIKVENNASIDMFEYLDDILSLTIQYY